MDEARETKLFKHKTFFPLQFIVYLDVQWDFGKVFLAMVKFQWQRKHIWSSTPALIIN